MRRPHRASGWVSSRASLWFGIGSLFVLVAVLAGPRALANLSARWRPESAGARTGTASPSDSPATSESAVRSVEVELSRVGFASTPEWMRGAVALAVMESLDADLVGSLDMMDEAGARVLRLRLQANPWVRSVALERRYPDRFQLELELRRPELEVRAGPEAERGHAAERVAVVDREGTVLPLPTPVEDLPWTFLETPNNFGGADRARGAGRSRIEVGEPFPDARIRAAAAVATEIRRELHALCPDMPHLAAVDANNLDYQYVSGRGFSEVRIALRGQGNQLVWLAWGHPPDSDAPRVPVATKAEVLRAILAERPGLVGVARGDLRFANRWRDWLIPSAPSGRR